VHAILLARRFEYLDRIINHAPKKKPIFFFREKQKIPRISLFSQTKRALVSSRVPQE
jgi:AAA+ ATPase superfamily predicted ATPase